jgi:PelA/Pel-15E family pectate lyase
MYIFKKALIVVYFLLFSLSSWADTREWEDYYEASGKILKKDQEFLEKELAKRNLEKPDRPEEVKGFGFDVIQPSDWFLGAEGKRVMSVILSFQTPSGGWSKATNMAGQPRQEGQAFGVLEDFTPTFDNAATSTQLRLLARAYSLSGDKTYRAAFDRGLNFIIQAQYPNGCWPQSFPLRGAYHDHITYNDSVMRNLMAILNSVSQARNEYSLATSKQRNAAKKSLNLALDCVVKTQVVVDGNLTVWGAQHDVKTLEPAKARAYEMPALSSTESASIVDFLMDLDSPSVEVIKSVHAAAKWYEQTKITGKTWTQGAKQLTNDPKATALWAHFYETATNKPVFGDSDNSIHYDLSKVSESVRQGSAWYTVTPSQVLAKYAFWKRQYPE